MSQHIGKRVAWQFKTEIFFGTITEYFPEENWWRVKFDDEDVQDFNKEELSQALALNQLVIKVQNAKAQKVRVEAQLSSEKKKANKLKKKVKEANEEIEAHKLEAMAANQEIGTLKAKVKADNQEIGTLKAKVKAANQEIGTLKAKVKTTNQEIEALKANAEEKTKEMVEADDKKLKALAQGCLASFEYDVEIGNIHAEKEAFKQELKLQFEAEKEAYKQQAEEKEQELRNQKEEAKKQLSTVIAAMGRLEAEAEQLKADKAEKEEQFTTVLKVIHQYQEREECHTAEMAKFLAESAEKGKGELAKKEKME